MHWQQQQPQEISHFKGFPSSYTATNVEINSAEEEGKWENGHSPFAEKNTNSSSPLIVFISSVFSRMASRVDFVSSASAFPSRGQQQQQQQQQQQRRFRSSNRVHISPAAAEASLQEAAAAAAAAGDHARVHGIAKSAAAASPLPRSENP